jgi:hypothetical protein
MLGDEPQKTVRAGFIRVIHDDYTRAQQISRWTAQRERSEINGRQRAPTVVENACHSRGGLRQLLEFQQGHDFNHTACLERIAILADLE